MPTKEQLKVFLSTVEKLSTFEREHRARAGWGCFQEDDELPVKEVVAVMDWLRSRIKDDFSDD
jgi:hypothetical protein